MIAQGVKLTIVARPYFSFSPPRDNEKLGLASQTRVYCTTGESYTTSHGTLNRNSVKPVEMYSYGKHSQLLYLRYYLV